MESKSSTDAAGGVKRLGANTYHVSAGGGAIITFSKLPTQATFDIGKVTNVNVPNDSKSVEVVYWGKKNDLPQYREELVTGNNIVPGLIERKRDIVCGQGWFAYKRRYVEGSDGQLRMIRDEVEMPPEAELFFKKFRKESRRLVGQAMIHGIMMPEYVRDLAKRVKTVRSLEIRYCRAAEKNAMGDIERWYWANFWAGEKNVKKEKRMLRELPVYNPESKHKQPRFVLPVQDDLFSDGTYPVPAYWGGRHWINLSNIIPIFHENNLENGQTPRFHVILPHDYFLDYEAMNRAVTEEDRLALDEEARTKEEQFVDDFNAILTDISNTGRTLVTKSEVVEALGGKYEKRIQIEEIKYDMKDEALLKLFAASNVANVSAQMLHPTLASVETGGKGIGSGTEVRTAFLLFLVIAAPKYRDMLDEVVDVVKDENGWPADIYYAIRDAELTTLADNPAGVQTSDTPIGAQ
jgi:hypothetical protein